VRLSRVANLASRLVWLSPAGCGAVTALEVEPAPDASLEPAPGDCPPAPLGPEWGPLLFGEAAPCSAVPFPLPDYPAVLGGAGAGVPCAYRPAHMLLSDYLAGRVGNWGGYVWLAYYHFACDGGRVVMYTWGLGFMLASSACPGDVSDGSACRPSTDLGNGECLVPSVEADLENGVVDGQVCACDRPGPIWRCVSAHHLPVPPLPP
jgi:hypothetical protein